MHSLVCRIPLPLLKARGMPETALNNNYRSSFVVYNLDLRNYRKGTASMKKMPVGKHQRYESSWQIGHHSNLMVES